MIDKADRFEGQQEADYSVTDVEWKLKRPIERRNKRWKKGSKILCVFSWNFFSNLWRIYTYTRAYFTVTGHPCSTSVASKNLAESSMNQRNDIFLSVSVTFTGQLVSPLRRRYLETHCTSDGSRELYDKYFTRW